MFIPIEEYIGVYSFIFGKDISTIKVNNLSDVDKACASHRFEADWELNLEICQIINKRGGNTPREAAIHIVRLINSRHPNVALLAVMLLDPCVKNCGYPFHLQIATKEFLNELVRKFPERPPPIPNIIMQRILQYIQEWKTTIFDTSRHKEDLKHIKDMYRLLRFKGYRFPGLSNSAVINATQNLKSAEELEEEDRVAQSAKLQELIRRGRPEDLLEANELMKVMAGYDQRPKKDYQQEANSELQKIRQRALVLNDMLLNVKPGERVERNDATQELRRECKAAQLKIQKFIGEIEDSERIEQLLLLNDLLNNILQKYDDLQRGIYDTSYDVNATPAETRRASEQAASLIDFDFAGTSTALPNPNSENSIKKKDQASLIDDLLGLSFSDEPQGGSYNGYGVGGSIALGDSSAPLFEGNQSVPASLFQPTFSSSTPSLFTHSGSNSDTPSLFDMDLLGNITSSITQKLETGSTSSRSISPLAMPSTISSQQTLPPIQLHNKNGLRIMLEPRWDTDNTLHLKAKFSNASTAVMTEFTFKVATPKSFQLKLEPQSSQTILPQSTDTVTQTLHILSANQDNLKIRYQVTYLQNGVTMEEGGEFMDFPRS